MCHDRRLIARVLLTPTTWYMQRDKKKTAGNYEAATTSNMLYAEQS